MGFRVRVAENARAIGGHTAGTVEQRLDDLHAMFADDAVRAIVCSIGGYNSNQLLDGLDYDLIRENPKILLGYSDPTFLLLGIHAVTGLATFHGPCVMVQFGEYGGLHPYTERWFRAVLMNAEPPGELHPSGLRIHERLEWDRDDTRPRHEERHARPRTLRTGMAEGRIVAGNLTTLTSLAGTRYLPDLQNAILCIEVSEEEPAAWADRDLTHLRLMGVFEEISALVVGRTHPGSGFSAEDPLERLLLDATEDRDLPLALGFDFGHTDPMFTLPIGPNAIADFGGGAPRLELTQGAVSGA